MKPFWLHPGVAIHPQPITWTCHVCGEERPDAVIAVHSTDLSKDFMLPPGTLQQNVRYCADKPACVEKAKTLRLIKAPNP